MSDLRKLTISAPDGHGRNATVTLDGQPLPCRSIVLRCSAEEITSAVIEFDYVAVEFDGLADVTGKIMTDEAPA